MDIERRMLLEEMEPWFAEDWQTPFISNTILQMQYIDRKDMPDQKPEIATEQPQGKRQPDYDRFVRNNEKGSEATGIYELTYINGQPQVIINPGQKNRKPSDETVNRAKVPEPENEETEDKQEEKD